MNHRSSTLFVYNVVFAEADNYIASHYKNNITVEEFSKAFNISRRTAQRSLAHYNTSWSKMLFEQRMRAASVFLVSTNLAIKQVAQRVGYSKPSEFTRAFKRYSNGVPPTAYRSKFKAPGKAPAWL